MLTNAWKTSSSSSWKGVSQRIGCYENGRLTALGESSALLTCMANAVRFVVRCATGAAYGHRMGDEADEMACRPGRIKRASTENQN